jgi:hypothetical protein
VAAWIEFVSVASANGWYCKAFDKVCFFCCIVYQFPFGVFYNTFLQLIQGILDDRRALVVSLASLITFLSSLMQKGNMQYTLLEAYRVPQIQSLHLFIFIPPLKIGIEKALKANASELNLNL